MKSKVSIPLHEGWGMRSRCLPRGWPGHLHSAFCPSLRPVTPNHPHAHARKADVPSSLIPGEFMVNRPKGLGTSEATRRSEGENTVGRLLLVAQRYSGDQVGSHVHKRGEGDVPGDLKVSSRRWSLYVGDPDHPITTSHCFLHPARPQPEQTNNPRGRSEPEVEAQSVWQGRRGKPRLRQQRLPKSHRSRVGPSLPPAPPAPH